MNALVKSEPKLMLLDYMADRYSLKPDEFGKTVRATCGLSTATAEQVAAFLIVAKEYNLNPLTKEIYAFPAKGGGVVPIVSIDGWVNLVNSNPQCDGFEFEMHHTPDGALVSCTCTMHRKDRSHPVSVTEYLEECKRPTDPWKMQHRMLRHKAMIQAARYAFGFAGIYDEDEGRTIAEVDVIPRDPAPPRNISKIEHKPEPETVIEHDPAPPDAEPEKAAEPIIQPVKPDEQLTPHKITGGTYESWSTSYIEAVQSAADPSVVMAWVDANQQQLDKLAKGSPDNAQRVKAATAKHVEFLHKTAPQTSPAAQGEASDDMGGESAPTAAKPPAGRRKPANKVPDIAKDYDGFISYAVDRLAKAEKPEDIEVIWDEVVDPVWSEITFPADKDALQGARRDAESRLEQ